MTEQRHPYSAELCDRLERIAWGKAATDIITSRTRIANVAIVTLPMFLWGHPERDTGRKSESPDGELLMPARVSWSSPGDVVVIGRGESVALSWRSPKCGSHPTKGKTSFVSDDDMSLATLMEPPLTSIPKSFTAPTQTRIEARRTLEFLARDGRDARWEILHTFEQNLAWNFNRALATVKSEMGLRGNVLDRATSEALQNRILFGDGADENPEAESLAFKLIDRCLTRETFARVDPTLYVRRWMFSTAESAIRRYIGDPHIGRKVRKVARELSTTDESLVIEEFTRRYPKGHLGARRVKDALTAPQRADQAATAFTFGDTLDPSCDVVNKSKGVRRQ